MGVGSKPFMDIQPSDAAISDRAVHYIMKSRGNYDENDDGGAEHYYYITRHLTSQKNNSQNKKIKIPGSKLISSSRTDFFLEPEFLFWLKITYILQLLFTDDDS